MSTSSTAAAEAPGANPAPPTPRQALSVFLRHASPRVLIAAALASLGARLALGGWSAWDLAPPVLILAWWPLQEWLIHVFILHYRPRRLGRWTLDFAVPREHRAHHREPWKLELLFIPKSSFFYSLPILAGLCLLLTPDVRLACTALTTYLVLALHYEWVHFLVHTRWSPRTRLYRRLWKNHRRHHFKNEHYWYGVTMLGGDRLLGTAPAHQDVPTSPTCRALLGKEEAAA